MDRGEANGEQSCSDMARLVARECSWRKASAAFACLLVLLGVLGFFFLASSPARAQSYACTDIGGGGGSAMLNLFGNCQTVTNYDGHTLCVTTANASEWGSFVGRPPQNVALAQCGDWSVGGWGGCSVGCGGGVQYRSVSCPYPGGCLGGAPGTAQSCNTQPCPINGSCNNGAAWSCYAGNAINGYDPGCGGNRTWQCQGLYGGGTDNCAQYTGACPVNGSCNNGAAWACNSGTPVNGVDAGCGGTRTWQCAGANGGGTDYCAQYTGACAPTGCPATSFTPPNCNWSVQIPAGSEGQTVNEYSDNGMANYAYLWGAGVSATCSGGSWSFSGGYCVYPDQNCFIADTKILMADGDYKEISALQAGDHVRGQGGTNTVEAVPSFVTSKPRYAINGSEAFVTAGHPFMTTEGWKAIDPAQTAEEGHKLELGTLAIGDEILREDGTSIAVTSIEAGPSEPVRVYNPRLDGDHTYFANGYLVHNK